MNIYIFNLLGSNVDKINELYKNKSTNKTLVWIMRQAGRYLPEYLELRKKAGSFMNLCFTPALAAEVTLQPLKRFDLDAAIIFSDILTIPYALGLSLEFKEKQGPVMQSVTDYKGLEILTKENFRSKLEPVYQAINIVKMLIDKEKSLIGFVGAPLTLASYVFYGGKNFDDFASFKISLYNNKEYHKKLNEILEENIFEHAISQIKAGCNVIKIFDSWSGILGSEEFFEYVIKPTKNIVKKIKTLYPNVPVICFPKGAGVNYLEFAKEIKPDILALDQYINLDFAKEELAKYSILQGNLDPLSLFAENAIIESKLENILNKLERGKFIFNLGHGITPKTNPEKLKLVIDKVKNG